MVEGETKKAALSSIKPGSFMVIEDAACRVSDIQISKPGKHGHAKARITGSGLIDDKKRVIVTSEHEVDVPVIDKRNAQVLSITGNMANLMDSESFDTFDLPIPDELKESVKEGSTIVYWIILNDKVMKQLKSD